MMFDGDMNLVGFILFDGKELVMVNWINGWYYFVKKELVIGVF